MEEGQSFPKSLSDFFCTLMVFFATITIILIYLLLYKSPADCICNPPLFNKTSICGD